MELDIAKKTLDEKDLTQYIRCFKETKMSVNRTVSDFRKFLSIKEELWEGNFIEALYSFLDIELAAYLEQKYGVQWTQYTILVMKGEI